MKSALRRFTAILLIATTSGFGWPQFASAGVIGTDSLVVSQSRDRVAAALARAEVRTQLEAYGVRPGDVEARLQALSDDEVAQLAQRIDSLPAGGLLEAILIIALIIVVLDIFGVTNVFGLKK
jgi:hypothetical protein